MTNNIIFNSENGSNILLHDDEISVLLNEDIDEDEQYQQTENILNQIDLHTLSNDYIFTGNI